MDLPQSGPPRSEMLVIWSAPALLVFAGIGFLAGGYLPPPSPALSAQEIAAFYAEHNDLRRLGAVALAMSGLFAIMYGTAVASRIRAIEGPRSPMASLQLGSAVLAGTLITVSSLMFATAAFRAQRDPGTIQAINDIAWVIFVGAFAPGVLNGLSLAIPVLQDPREHPTLPRWLGWFCLWVAIVAIADALVPFFETGGAFGWSGAVSFWLAGGAFLGWYLVTFVVLLRAGRADRALDAGDAHGGETWSRG